MIRFGGKEPVDIVIGGKVVSSISMNGDVVWTKGPTGPNYFYIENLSSSSNIISLWKHGTPTTGTTIEYSKDETNWTTATYDSNNKCNITLNSLNDKVYFRSTDGFSQGSGKYYSFLSTKSITAGGDLRTLLDYSDLNLDTATANCFNEMFGNTGTMSSNDVQIYDASNLDFSGLKNLANYCYSGMFNSSHLYVAPELPATNLANSCYSAMFQNCTYLNTPPTELPATTLVERCYSNMFYNCPALTETPIIRGTNTASYCFLSTFYSCSSLNKITVYATTWNTTNSTNWVSGVAATGDFYNLCGATIPTGANGIPSGWTEHTSL